MTFFYVGPVPTDYEKRESSIVKKTRSNLSLPPTLDALIPNYLIVFTDSIGHRKSMYKANIVWNALERATVTTCQSLRSDHDFSYVATMLEDNRFDAVIVGAIIPRHNISIIDIIATTSSSS